MSRVCYTLIGGVKVLTNNHNSELETLLHVLSTTNESLDGNISFSRCFLSNLNQRDMTYMSHEWIVLRWGEFKWKTVKEMSSWPEMKRKERNKFSFGDDTTISSGNQLGGPEAARANPWDVCVVQACKKSNRAPASSAFVEHHFLYLIYVIPINNALHYPIAVSWSECHWTSYPCRSIRNMSFIRQLYHHVVVKDDFNQRETVCDGSRAPNLFLKRSCQLNFGKCQLPV